LQNVTNVINTGVNSVQGDNGINHSQTPLVSSSAHKNSKGDAPPRETVANAQPSNGNSNVKVKPKRTNTHEAPAEMNHKSDNLTTTRRALII
jgi:hypothetical protein